MRLYTHFDTKSLNNPKIQHPSKFWENKCMIAKKNKDQNDNVGKIYRFETSFDMFYWKFNKNEMIGKRIGFSSCIPISESGKLIAWEVQDERKGMLTLATG